MVSTPALMRHAEGVSEAWIDFWVHVRPGGRHDGLEGSHDGVLAVRVAAPPTEGKANHAVCKVVAQALGVARLDVKVIGGRTGKRKLLRAYGDASVLADRLGALLGIPPAAGTTPGLPPDA